MREDRAQPATPATPALICIEKDEERQVWAQSLGVREDLLVLTVKIVGNSVPAGNLGQMASGAQISVTVSVQYDPVRWIDGFKGLDGVQIASTTLMRRE